jgi:hypothetical protein
MTNARITLSTKNTGAEGFARELRSLAAKIDAGDLTPGATLTVGNTRIKVAVPQEHPVRKFARENGFEVGSRGRFSADLLAAYEAHKRAERKAKREAREARKAEREAQAVNA